MQNFTRNSYGGSQGYSGDSVSSTEKKGISISLYHLTLLMIFSIAVNYRVLSSPNIAFLEITSYSLLVFYLFNKLATKQPWSHDLLNVYRENKVLFFYFSWAAFTGILGVAFRSSTISLSVFRNMIPGFIIYLFVIIYIKDLRRLKLLLSIYLLGVFIHLFIGLSQGLTGGPQITQETQATSSKLDIDGKIVSGNLVRGFFNHPNGFAQFFIPNSILIINAILTKLYKKVVFQLVLISSLPVLIYSLNLTYAKGAYLWMIFGIGFLLLPKIFNKWRFHLGIASVIIGVIAILAYSFESLASGNSALGTILTRTQLWQSAITAMQEDNIILLIGNGSNSVLNLSNIYSNIEYPNAHNGLLNQVLFFGIPALISYLWFSISALYKVANLIKNYSGYLKTFSLFIFSAILSLLGSYFFEPSNAMEYQAQFFLLIALANVLEKIAVNQNSLKL